MRYAWYAIRGIQSHVIPSIIETRSQIETWWQMPELQRTQTPICGPTQWFQAKSACLYQFFSAENCSYTIPSFSVITVEMRRIKYQIGLHDGSTKLWMDSFMPSRRVLGIHSLYLQQLDEVPRPPSFRKISPTRSGVRLGTGLRFYTDHCTNPY